MLVSAIISYPTLGRSAIVQVEVEEGETFTEAFIARGDAVAEWELQGVLSRTRDDEEV